MRRSLKKIKEADEKVKEWAEEEKTAKKSRKKKIKVREPNVWGGGFVIVSLLIIFFAVRAVDNPQQDVLESKDQQLQSKKQNEEKKAFENVTTELEATSENVKDNIENINVVDSAMESADKVSNDIDAVSELPAKTGETVKNLKIGDAFSVVLSSFSRLSKIYKDITGVKDDALEQIEKL